MRISGAVNVKASDFNWKEGTVSVLGKRHGYHFGGRSGMGHKIGFLLFGKLPQEILNMFEGERWFYCA